MKSLEDDSPYNIARESIVRSPVVGNATGEVQLTQVKARQMGSANLIFGVKVLR